MLASPKRSALLSGTLHCAAILLILAVTGVKPPLIPKLRDILVVPFDIHSYKKTALASHGGGGGGAHADSPASLGDPVRFDRRQFIAPAVDIVKTTPLLPVEPTLIGDPDIQLASFYGQIGDPNGVLGRLSAGPGTGNGIGSGDGTGIGPGKGPGLGPGEGGNTGGGVEYLGAGGGSITAPTLLFKTEPEYSEEARKARLQGTVLLRIEVDTHGLAQNISVRQHLGLGLDDRAVDAVKKWKFNPGKLNGKPTATVAYVEVNFRLL